MKKWLLSYRYNDISCAHARGHALLREIFGKNVQFGGSWCIFVLDFF